MIRVFKLPVFVLWLLFTAACSGKLTVTHSDEKFYTPEANSSAEQDSVLLNYINPYRSELTFKMSEVIARSEFAMEKGRPESLLGNLVADLCFETITSDGKFGTNERIFCVLNTGGLRNSLPAGDINTGNIYELMPFENELVVLTLSGNSTQELLEYIARKNGEPVANLKLKLNNGTYTEALIGEKEFNSGQEYKVITSDYLANGGDSMNMFKDATNFEYTGIKIRDAIIDYMKSKGSQNIIITSKLDGRISD